jgi:hypothetical protein
MFDANGTALAAGGSIPVRLGVFFWGDGVKLDRWNPVDMGPTYTLSPELLPLMPVRDYCSVVSGMNVMTGNPQGHHAGTVGILSGAPLITQPHPNSPYMSTFSKPSIDQVAAAAIGMTTSFKSLEVGVSPRVTTDEGTTLHYLSHNGPNSPNPPEYDPAAVYSRIFSGGTGATPGMVDKTLALRKSVLDAVMVDIGALRGQVSAADQARLDQHLDNIRTIEHRLMMPTVAPSVSACQTGTNPGSFPDQMGNEQIEPITQAMSGLIALALACDQTRVFSMMFTGSVAQTMFWEVMAPMAHHPLTHQESGNQPFVHATTVFTMKMFATLLQALSAVPEGAGTLLDNVVILASTDVADGKTHTLTDYPIVVAGAAGGKLKKPGVHYRSKGENTSKVLLTVLRAAGVPLTQFGTSGGLVMDSCTAIEA